MANQAPVVLVDEADRPIGQLDKMTAHTEGHRHRAFSVMLYRHHPEHGIQLLLQQRHPNKYHSGNLWTNTCCSHPYPEETPLEAAHRRLGEELNIAHTELQYLGKIAYQVATGTMIENEIDHVFIGHFDQDISNIHPHPQEISALKWMAWDTLQTSLHSEPTHYTAWLPHLMPLIAQHIQTHAKQITEGDAHA